MARIMIIDDEVLARFAIREVLEQAGHEVLEAGNGMRGIELQKKEKCDLIITDIIMPEKGGLSTIVEMKRDDENIKIIAISGGERKDGHDYLGHADDLGANKSLAKPFNDDELLECVNSCLNGDASYIPSEQEDASSKAENQFKRFMPKEFMKMLGVDDMSKVELGNHIEKQITVMFSDIRNFTTLSESMLPKETFEFINAFLSNLVPIIHENGGLIDKFIGDAVMALFCESPDNAIMASLAILRSLDEINEKNEKNKVKPIHIGIGLNTGMVMMGTVGSKDRMEPTVVGDAVNISSRLETLTKTYGVHLIISEATLNALNDPSTFSIRFIDRLRVKGKIRATSVYEVFDNNPKALRQAKRQTQDMFESALAYYHLEEVGKAKELLDQCLQIAPDDSVARMYMKRCMDFFGSGHHEGTDELNKDFAWKNSYQLNIPEVDNQHKELLINLNRLSRMIRNEDAKGIKDVMEFLETYTHIHFKTEESLMLKYGYPFIKEHTHEHGWFIEHYKNLRKKIAQQRHDNMYLFFNINVFLVDWLLNHIATTDNHMGKYIMRAGYKAAASRLHGI